MGNAQFNRRDFFVMFGSEAMVYSAIWFFATIIRIWMRTQMKPIEFRRQIHLIAIPQNGKNPDFHKLNGDLNVFLGIPNHESSAPKLGVFARHPVGEGHFLG